VLSHLPYLQCVSALLCAFFDSLDPGCLAVLHRIGFVLVCGINEVCLVLYAVDLRFSHPIFVLLCCDVIP